MPVTRKQTAGVVLVNGHLGETTHLSMYLQSRIVGLQDASASPVPNTVEIWHRWCIIHHHSYPISIFYSCVHIAVMVLTVLSELLL